MLLRKAYQDFLSWKHADPGKALLVTGARQVGKSYLVSAFARAEFAHTATFDLIENARARESFAQAGSADDLLLRISVASDERLVPGETVIVIDEIQECPNILTYCKYLVQRGDFRYILTGSLLGARLKNIDSLPVGYVRQVAMHPLDFEEFCWALGLDASAFAMAHDLLRSETALPDFLYARLLDLFHRYLIVGGMPDAVNAFVSDGTIDHVRTVHQDLHALYRQDITKYAPEELRLVIRDIYDLIPSEAGSKNRRFKLSDIQDVKRFSQVSDHFLWLTQAGVALPVYQVNAPVSPLLVGVRRAQFKLFYLDAGLLASSYPKSSYAGLLDGSPSMNMGGVYEALVTQELVAHRLEPRYFTSKKVGELDFVVEHADGSIDALEVKSGSSYLTHAALDNALATQGYTIDRAFVLAETNIRREGPILYMPIFLAGALADE